MSSGRRSRCRPGARIRAPHRTSVELDRILLAILGRSAEPLSAYRISRRSTDAGTPLAPNQVYRILDRLLATGRIRRVEALNAYILSDGQPGPILFCRICARVTNLDAGPAPSRIRKLCIDRGFRIGSAIIEVPGVCRDCQDRQQEAGRTTDEQQEAGRTTDDRQ